MIRRRSGLAGLALLLSAASAVGAQETRCERGDVEVMSLAFSGNRAFNDATLAVGIVTTPSTWARRVLRLVGTKHCLDQKEFPLDVIRLTFWYRNHGFTDATVDTVVTRVGVRRVAVRFDITEGAPVVVDTVRFEGLDAVPERARIIAGLPARVGGRFDRYSNRATKDTITRRLRDGGYPDAEAFLGYDLRTTARSATVIFSVLPGPRRRIGRIDLTRTGLNGRPPEVTEAAVRRLAGLEPGDLYRERDLERAKRTLYQSEAFTQVEVQPGPVGTDSLFTVDIDVTEAALRSARIGGGWGTLDCFRTTAELTEANLFKTATRLELRSRVSKIGMGDPLGGAERLCSRTATEDTYGRFLNYYTSATLSQPSLQRASFVPTLSLYSERRSEFKAFLRTAPIGASLALNRTIQRRSLNLGYSVELGRTEAQPALFCAVFSVCVEADRLALQQLQRVAVLSAATSYEFADNSGDPSRGVVARGDVRYASRFTGSDEAVQFARITSDGTVYRPLGRDIVLAVRVRVGGVLGPTLALDKNASFVPAQERLFAGGPSTVRGFQQNELGPAVYIPERYDTIAVATGSPVSGPIAIGQQVWFRSDSASRQRAVPTGGNAMVVGNVELRFVSPFLTELLKWTAFVDVGRVWNRGAGSERLQFATLAATPGFGVRIRTPIGYLRVDLAYNPYERPSGAAYFDAPLTEGGALYCVSPGNTLTVTKQVDPTNAARTILTQITGPCPSSFQPPRGNSFLSRLRPSIAIGQAF